MSDQTILDHLQGRHVIGVYALPANETCWFPAAEHEERADIAAFRQTW